MKIFTKTKNWFEMLYFNGALSLIICLLIIIPIDIIGEYGGKIGAWIAVISMLCVVTVTGVIFHRVYSAGRNRKSKVFTVRKTIGGYLINQSIKRDSGCLAKIFSKDIERGLNELQNGTYICYTHMAVIKRIEKFAKTSGKNVEIITIKPFKASKLALVKRQAKRIDTCKNCKRKETCPFLKPNAKPVQMYGVKFKIS